MNIVDIIIRVMFVFGKMTLSILVITLENVNKSFSTLDLSWKTMKCADCTQKKYIK